MAADFESEFRRIRSAEEEKARRAQEAREEEFARAREAWVRARELLWNTFSDLSPRIDPLLRALTRATWADQVTVEAGWLKDGRGHGLGVPVDQLRGEQVEWNVFSGYAGEYSWRAAPRTTRTEHHYVYELVLSLGGTLELRGRTHRPTWYDRSWYEHAQPKLEFWIGCQQWGGLDEIIGSRPDLAAIELRQTLRTQIANAIGIVLPCSNASLQDAFRIAARCGPEETPGR